MSSQIPPIIPPRLSLLLPQQKVLQATSTLNKRKASAQSFILQLVAEEGVSVTQFVGAKIEETAAVVEYADELRLMSAQQYDEKRISKNQHEEIIAEIEKSSIPKEQELRILKRQKKTLQDEITEETGNPSLERLENAYASVLLRRVSASAAVQKKENFNSQKFRNSLLTYYDANEPADGGRVWCVVMGWENPKHVKAAHIVPKVMEGDEVANMFGDKGNAGLRYDPKNGLILHRNIELAMDLNQLVFVPIGKTSLNSPLRFKVVITDNDLMLPKAWITSKERFRDIHNKELVFRNSNRPAARYLYFRYVMTYLWHKKKGNSAWAAEIDAKGTMWATPGSYLRGSLLKMLARKVSDRFLPETIYGHQSFEDGETQMKEDDASMAVQVLAEKFTAAVETSEADRDEDEDE